MAETILVLTGNEAEFDTWLKENPNLRHKAVWGDTVGVIRKVTADQILECGTFRERKDASQMMSAAIEGLRPRK